VRCRAAGAVAGSHRAGSGPDGLHARQRGAGAHLHLRAARRRAGGLARVPGGWRGERADRHWVGALRSGALRLLLTAVVLVGAGVGSLPVAMLDYAESVGHRSFSSWL